jgi:uncharacterized membrane protein YeiH
MIDWVALVSFIVEACGVVAFAISAAIVSIRKRADSVGVLVLAETTVFGGGIIRDVILGITPPHVFWDKQYIALSLLTAVIAAACYALAFSRRASAFLDRHRNDFWLNLFDSIGLAVYCVSGINTAIEAGFGQNEWLLIFVGCITGVGGGVLRDVMSSELPLIFRKRVYFLPVLIGSVLYAFIFPYLPQLAAMGDVHFSVEKGERGGRTYTQVVLLDREQRKAELARITGGNKVTDALLE